MKRMVWLDEKKNEIIDLYAGGYTQAEIAKEFNISTTTISTKLRKWGVSNPDVSRFRRIEIDKDELYEMYWDKKMHPIQIAKKYGCHKQVITNNLIKYDIPYRSSQPILDYEYIKKSFEDDGYTLLSDKYINAKSYLHYKCLNEHVHKINWNNWKSGKRCPYCKGVVTITFDALKKDFSENGYQLLSTESECKNSHSYVEYECPKGHISTIRITNWRQGYRCTKCSNNVSRWEQEVKDFVKSLNIDIEENVKKVVYNPKTNRSLELDIFVRETSKAIECNGIYWHSFPDRIALDKIKVAQCKLQGINLLTITDEEWHININDCKFKILEFFSLEDDNGFKRL